MAFALDKNVNIYVSSDSLTINKIVYDRVVSFNIEPFDGIVLCLLDGMHTENDILQILHHLFPSISIKELKLLVLKVLNDYRRFIHETDRHSQKVDSRKIINIIKDIKRYKNKIRNGAPKYVSWFATRRCDKKCVYCHVKTSNNSVPKDELNTAEICYILDEAKQLGSTTLMITGGEPFLRKDIYHIIGKALYDQWNVDIITKYLFAKKNVNELFSLGLRNITISLDSPSSSISDYFVGCNGYHNNMLKVIEMFKNIGISVNITSIVTPQNIKYLKQWILLCKKYSIDQLHLNNYSKSIKYIKTHFNLNKRQEESVFRTCLEIKNRLPYLDIRYNKKPFDSNKLNENVGLVCNVGINKLYILSNGKISRCDNMHDSKEFIVGDLRRNTILEIWNSYKMLKAIYPSRQKYINTNCYKCESFDACNKRGRCFVDSYEINNRFYSPDSFCTFK